MPFSLESEQLSCHSLSPWLSPGITCTPLVQSLPVIPCCALLPNPACKSATFYSWQWRWQRSGNKFWALCYQQAPSIPRGGQSSPSSCWHSSPDLTLPQLPMAWCKAGALWWHQEQLLVWVGKSALHCYLSAGYFLFFKPVSVTADVLGRQEE